MQRKHLLRLAIGAGLAGLGIAAQAHPGHGPGGLVDGLTHPFGIDHLLAMVAVGLWSATVLPRRSVWQGPATFLLSLMAGAELGLAGVAAPALEQALALSVTLFGAMLVLGRRLTPALGLPLIALAAGLHGLAHGIEAPATGLAAYAAGFLLTTACLHLGGVGLGLAIRRWLAERSSLALGSLGSALGLAGLYLFGQLLA